MAGALRKLCPRKREPKAKSLRLSNIDVFQPGLRRQKSTCLPTNTLWPPLARQSRSQAAAISISYLPVAKETRSSAARFHIRTSPRARRQPGPQQQSHFSFTSPDPTVLANRLLLPPADRAGRLQKTSNYLPADRLTRPSPPPPPSRTKPQSVRRNSRPSWLPNGSYAGPIWPARNPSPVLTEPTTAPFIATAPLWHRVLLPPVGARSSSRQSFSHQNGPSSSSSSSACRH